MCRRYRDSYFGSLLRLCFGSLLRLCFGSLLRLCFGSLLRLCFGSLLCLCFGNLLRLCFGSLLCSCFGSLLRLCFGNLLRLCFGSLLCLLTIHLYVFNQVLRLCMLQDSEIEVSRINGNYGIRTRRQSMYNNLRLVVYNDRNGRWYYSYPFIWERKTCIKVVKKGSIFAFFPIFNREKCRWVFAFISFWAQLNLTTQHFSLWRPCFTVCFMYIMYTDKSKSFNNTEW